jgi:hypothetical protein
MVSMLANEPAWPRDTALVDCARQKNSPLGVVATRSIEFPAAITIET